MLAEVMSRVKEHTLGCSSGTSGAGENYACGEGGLC